MNEKSYPSLMYGRTDGRTDPDYRKASLLKIFTNIMLLKKMLGKILLERILIKNCLIKFGLKKFLII